MVCETVNHFLLLYCTANNHLVVVRDEEESELEIFPSHLHGVVSPRVVKVNNETTVEKMVRAALPLFGIPSECQDMFQLTEMTLDKGVLERVMGPEEQPWEVLKATSRDSLRQMELTRFYLQRKEDPHGPTIALYVGNLPCNLSQRQYEQILIDILGSDNKYSSIGPIYYEYGALVITYINCEEAVRAFYTCRDAFVKEKNLIGTVLSFNQPDHYVPWFR
jgi:diacylglycerol kinase (ATP)